MTGRSETILFFQVCPSKGKEHLLYDAKTIQELQILMKHYFDAYISIESIEWTSTITWIHNTHPWMFFNKYVPR